MKWFSKFFSRTSSGQINISKMTKISDNPDGGFTISMNKEYGLVGDKHYTEGVENINALKREGRHAEAIDLLLRSVDATERESRVAGRGWGVAPWYYAQLAIIYRKEKRYRDEVAILERYERQPKALGAGPAKLKERLQKARQLLQRQNA